MKRSRERLAAIAAVLCLSLLFGWLFSVYSTRKLRQEVAALSLPPRPASVDPPAPEPAPEAVSSPPPVAASPAPPHGPYTAERFDQEWREIMASDVPESHKIGLLGQSIYKMCKLGHITAATRKILGSFGPGDNRNRLLRLCFNPFGDSSELEAAYALLEFDDEKQWARRGIASLIAREAFQADKDLVIDPAKHGFIKEHLPQLREEAVISYLDWVVREAPGNAKQALEANLTGDLSPAARNSVLTTLAPLIPFESWDAFTAPDQPGDHQTGMHIVDRMLADDPAATLQTISKTDTAGDYIPKAMQDWMRKDARKPIEWLEANRATLSGKQLDGAITGIVSYSSIAGERETAYAWARQIGEEGDRVEVLGELDKRFAAKER